MVEGADASDFDASRAELFEALGHPVRIRILHALQDGPLGFADLKRSVGIESGGHLQFHLGKLDGLLRSGEDGNYSLTDDGREALRIVGARGASVDEEMKPEAKSRVQLKGRISISRSILAVIIAALVLTSSVAVYQQYQLGTLQAPPTYGTTTIGINDYWYMTLPAASIAPDTAILFHGLNFNFMPDPSFNGGQMLWSNGSAIDTPGMVASCGHNMSDVKSTVGPVIIFRIPGSNTTNQNSSVFDNDTIVYTFEDNSTCTIFLGSVTAVIVPQPSQTTVVVTFPDGSVSGLSSGWPFPNAPIGVNSTYGLARSGATLVGVGSPWLSTHLPFAGLLLNPDNGTVTIYVREY